MNVSTLVAQITSTNTSDDMSVIWIIVSLAVSLLLIVSMWRIFDKANKPGWAAIIPFYNIYVQLKVIGRPGWWLLLYFIPIVNLIIHIIVSIDLAKVFGKDAAFGVLGLWLFSFIGYPILGFGEAKYKGALKH